jgi:hypothetical protein
MGNSPKLVAWPGRWTTRNKFIAADNREEEEMEAYRIARFGSVDGIVLRSSEDPHPKPKEVLIRARELAQLPGSDGPQGWRSRPDEARRRAAKLQ